MFKQDYDQYMSFDQLEGEVRNHHDRWKQVLDFLHSGERGSLLDVGAGTGHLAHLLKEKKWPAPIVLCDIKKDYVEKLNEHGHNAILASIADLPFKDREFDIVTACELLEHLPDPGKGLSELLRVAKKRVIVTLPCKQSKDDWHGFLIRAEVVGQWCILEFLRREGNE